MTIKEIINQLESIAKKYGDDTLVYFDCPKCGAINIPNKLVTKAVIIHTDKNVTK